MWTGVLALALVVGLCEAGAHAQSFGDGVVRLGPLLPHAGSGVATAFGGSPTLLASTQSVAAPTREGGWIGVPGLALAGAGAAVAADDSGIYKTLVQKSGHSTISRASEIVTDAANVYYVAPALGLLALTGGRTNRAIAWKSSLAIAKAGAMGDILKWAVGRKRPDGPDGGSSGATFQPGEMSAAYGSFPSGHTIVAFSVATVWAAERPHERYAAYSYASLAALSRIELGRHWPSDVFWAAILGASQGRQAVRGNTNLFTITF